MPAPASGTDAPAGGVGGSVYADLVLAELAIGAGFLAAALAPKGRELVEPFRPKNEVGDPNCQLLAEDGVARAGRRYQFWVCPQTTKAMPWWRYVASFPADGKLWTAAEVDVESEYDQTLGQRVRFPGYAMTHDFHRQRGLARDLYRVAVQDACANKQFFTSDTTRSQYAENLWKRQEKAGRAACLRGSAPGNAMWTPDGAKPGMPRPKALQIPGQRLRYTWKCRRYVADCRKAFTSLSGLRASPDR